MQNEEAADRAAPIPSCFRAQPVRFRQNSGHSIGSRVRTKDKLPASWRAFYFSTNREKTWAGWIINPWKLQFLGGGKAVLSQSARERFNHAKTFPSWWDGEYGSPFSQEKPGQGPANIASIVLVLPEAEPVRKSPNCRA